MHRVVLTGLGAITPIGLSCQEFWCNLTTGVSGVAPITSFDVRDFDVRIAAEVHAFEPRNFMDFKAARRMDRFAQFAVAASGEALRDARLDIQAEPPDRAGVMLNTGGGGIHTLIRETLVYADRGPSRVSPFTIPMVSPNMAACQVSITYGIRGPVKASVAACAAGIQAVVDAYRMLQLGDVDVMVVGGAEALVGLAVVGFSNMGALSKRNDEPTRASRPFDKDRDGCVLGEGACVYIMETAEHALQRDAPIYCEVLGGALTADAYHMSVPSPDAGGAARAMQLALQNARLTPRDVDYICAHGSSTPLNDPTETAAIKATFGAEAYRIPISSTKSMVGHMFGAAGAVSVLASALAIRDNLVPPTINLDSPDPLCDLDYVPHTARPASVSTVMANAFGFGGQNAVALFRRWQE
jgi:3-oxoacyl-[acyl-carrier-protein] synthase II